MKTPTTPTTPSKTPSADESAAILTDYLARREPFFFVRYGDGAIECIYGEEPGGPINGRTCDGEVYSKDLALALLDAWVRLETAEGTVFAGDWQSATFGRGSGHNRELDRWTALTFNAPFAWIHFESLLLMRRSEALVKFYRTLRDPESGRKVYLGPHEAAARFLRARHVKTPMVPDLIHRTEELVEELESEPFDVCVYGAGMAGNVAAVDSWERGRDRTYISLGSALDPLFGHKTRTQQLAKPVLLAMFRGML